MLHKFHCISKLLSTTHTHAHTYIVSVWSAPTTHSIRSALRICCVKLVEISLKFLLQKKLGFDLAKFSSFPLQTFVRFALGYVTLILSPVYLYLVSVFLYSTLWYLQSLKCLQFNRIISYIRRASADEKCWKRVNFKHLSSYEIIKELFLGYLRMSAPPFLVKIKTMLRYFPLFLLGSKVPLKNDPTIQYLVTIWNNILFY